MGDSKAIRARLAALPVDGLAGLEVHTLPELRAFAKALGATFDAKHLEDEGPCGELRGAGSGADPDELLEAHLAEAGPDPLEERGATVDVRRFLPYSGLEPLGSDGSGDPIYLEPRKRTRKGPPPVVRTCHDQALTAVLEANGLFELAARGILERWAEANGETRSAEVRRLLETPVELADEPPLADVLGARPAPASRTRKKRPPGGRGRR